MSTRIPPAQPPYSPLVQASLDRILPAGMEPLLLFTTLARDDRLYSRFMSGNLLDAGHLTLRQREIVIDRTTALCRSEYEFGVHVAIFAKRADLTDDMLDSLARGSADDVCWSPEEALLIRACDQLHQSADIDGALWNDLRSLYSELALLEVIMLAGIYRTVSYLTNALRLPPEPFAKRFPDPPIT
jgi:alkylhydroperoxidase family enzyme